MIKCEKKRMGVPEGNRTNSCIECSISGSVKDIFAEYATVRRAIFENISNETDGQIAQFVLDKLDSIRTESPEEFGNNIDALGLAYAEIVLMRKENGDLCGFLKTLRGGIPNKNKKDD